MKKFLSIVSLLTVALMLLTALPVSAEEVSEEVPFSLPLGIRKYYANDISGKAPVLDGVISEGEYGKLTARIENPSLMVGDTKMFDRTNAINEDLKSEYMDFWFAYDENFIYIAVHDAGVPANDNGDDLNDNDVPYRSNYFFTLGFELTDLSMDIRFGGSGTNSIWQDLRYHELGKANVAPVKTYTFSEGIVRKVDRNTGADLALGDFFTTNGNVNSYTTPWEVYMEIKIDKSALVDALNKCYFTDYDEIPNAMYFDFSCDTSKKVDAGTTTSQFYNWIGDNDVTDKQGEYEAFGLWEGIKRETIFDLIVFGDENTVVTPAEQFPERPETEAPVVTEPTTEAPVVDETEAPSEGEATEAPATSTEGGCGGMISATGLALVATLGMAVTVISKKKKD